MTRKGGGVFLVALCGALVCFFLPRIVVPVGAGEVNFKAVSMLPKGNPVIQAFEMLVKDFNENFKGEASINWVGGPELIPAFQLHEAVRSGAIDMGATSCSYYTALLPVSHSIMYSNKTHEEVKATGFFEVFADLHKQVGLVYLGEMAYGRQFYIYINVPVKSPKDLIGKKIRVFPAIMPFVNALGAAPINMAMPEIYTAMERGVVDGFVMAPIGFVKGFSWHEVTKYMIEPGFYRGSVAWLVNPRKWEQLPKDLQARIVTWKYDVFDPKAEKFYISQGNAHKQMIYDTEKTDLIRFSPADAEAYLNLAYDSAWDGLIKRSPDVAEKLKAMLVK